FQWKWGAPAWPDGPIDYCTIRWRGYLRVPETGQYAFQVINNEGLRLFLDNIEVFSRWTPQGAPVETAVSTLEKGHHAIVLECFKSQGRGAYAFSWKKVDGLGENQPNLMLLHDPA